MASDTRIVLVSDMLFNTKMVTIEETRRRKLAFLRDECGSVRKLADKLGRSSSQVSQWINASADSKTGKPRSISNSSARDIERKLDKPTGWMDQPCEYSQVTPNLHMVTSNVKDITLLTPFRKIPIVGMVRGGDDGYLVNLECPSSYSDGSIINFLAKNKDTYALRVRGDAMSPRIKDGEFIIIDLSPEPTPGDDVIICLTSGKKMVKEYLYKKNGRYTFGSINNSHDKITESEKVIKNMHCVAAIIPRGSFYNSY